MEFVINKPLFSEALSLVNTVVPERAARAVMQNLMLTGNQDGTITLSATDLEIGVRVTLDASNMQEPGSVLLPSSRLNALVKGATGDEVTLSIQDNKAELRTKQGRFNLPGADVLDYPTIPAFKPEGSIFVHGDDFVEAVQKTMFATAKGDTRYALNGIYLNVQETNADFVASDTHRLSLVKKKIRNPDNSAFDGIILVKGMSILARLAANTDVVELNLTANELLARTTNAVVVIRRVDGMFPRYADVIPAKSESFFTVSKEELLHSLQSVGLIASDETKAVIFKVEEKVLTISAASEHGDGAVTLDVENEGKDIEIKFNYSFMIDALKNISEDKVTVQYTDPEQPARIDSADFLYVLMPINR